MNFIEIKKVNKEFKFQKDSLEKAKASVDQIMEMRKLTDEAAETDTNLADAIMEANAETEAGTSNIEAFLNSYDDTMHKLEILIERSDERIREFDEVEKTTSYLTNSMLEIIKKNMERLDKDESDRMKHLKIYYKEVYNIFSNRTSIDFLLEKMDTKTIELRRLKTSLKKDKNGDVLKATQKKVTGFFTSVFNVKQLESVEKYLIDLFESEELAFYFQYVLSLIYEREKTHNKYGRHKWVEVVFLNIGDIIVENYDLEGGKDFYDTQLLKLKDKLVSIL
jgi:hypothetical protein